MSSETTLDLTCPTCRHQWQADLKYLDRFDQVIYRGSIPRQRTEQYRARCPQCGAYAIADVLIQEE